MNQITSNIPGLRSNKTWKKIIAFIYYLLTLLMFIGEWHIGLLFLSMPFMVFSIIDMVRHRKKSIPLKKAVIPFIVSFALMSVAINGMPANPDNTGGNVVVQNEISEDKEQKTDQAEKAVEEQKPAENKGENSEGEKADAVEETPEKSPETEKVNSQGQPSETATLEVHFIDVGQADSILLKQGNSAMLIDAGNNADSNLVKSYISNQGITKLDYVIGTHPHEDHIGGLDVVINSFDIGKVYMPKASTTTKTYEDVLTAISNKGLKISVPTPGSSFNLGEATVTILGPNSANYDDLNNYSIVARVSFGNNSFIFSGDAEEISENEILNKGFNIKADLLKVGHHGSASSTSLAFLKAVSPKYAVIMVGADNSYGHPHGSTMERLKAEGIQVYRTDENGTIVAISDGNNITFNTKPGSYKSRGAGSTAGSGQTPTAPGSSTNSGSSANSGSSSNQGSSSNSGSTSSSGGSSGEGTVTKPSASNSVPSDNKSKTVYYTPSGKSYHYSKDCRTLSRSKTILSQTLEEALKSSHSDPCDVCAN